jgi:hypothetical protein
MGTLLLGGLALLSALVSLVAGLVVVAHAFRSRGVAEGFLCLFAPFYILYYAVARFGHPRRGLVIGLWLGGVAGSVVVMTVMGLTATGGVAYY